MRTYGDGCGIAHALDLVGERWALLVVRELLLGPKRFTDLRAGLPNASPNVLSQRLRELEQAGVVSRRKLPPPAAAWVYELTEWGRGLQPIVIAFGLWALRSPSFSSEEPVSADSIALALVSHFDAEAAAGLDASVELHLGEEPFRIRIAEQAMKLERGTVEQPDVVIATDVATLRAAIWSGQPSTDGELQIEGDRDLAGRFLTLFPLPVAA